MVHSLIKEKHKFDSNITEIFLDYFLNNKTNNTISSQLHFDFNWFLYFLLVISK
jgi:hypothetical protein